MINALFVYGSLAPGEKNQHYLKALAGSWQRATTIGKAYPDGLPGTEGYPALRLADTKSTCAGLLFTSNELDQIWETLDAFEGASYVRTQITVTLLDGLKTLAHCYVYNEDFNV